MVEVVGLRLRNGKTICLIVLFVIMALVIPLSSMAAQESGNFALLPETLDLAEVADHSEALVLAARVEMAGGTSGESDSEWGDESITPPEFEEEEMVTIADPLEPINRIFFAFNDKLYFWLLKPIAKGYSKVVPEPARVGVRNFFSNLLTPVRVVNCVLQGKFKGAGTEVLRLIINSTVGFLGFQDVAKQEGHLKIQQEDLGQSLGVYGLGPGIYINWPIFGPSSLRDTVGMIGDAFLDPINYAVTRTKYNIAVKGYDKVNKTSLTLGDYESLKKAAVDPYVAVRDAYFQYRRNLIKK